MQDREGGGGKYWLFIATRRLAHSAWRFHREDPVLHEMRYVFMPRLLA